MAIENVQPLDLTLNRLPHRIHAQDPAAAI